MTPTCEEHGHSWSQWWSRDTNNLTVDGYVYGRECNIMGCFAIQHAKRLEPVGDAPITEERGSRD